MRVYVFCFIMFLVRLNGSRVVTGVLRGFDPFMNLVIDEAFEELKNGEKNALGMVVSITSVTKHGLKNVDKAIKDLILNISSSGCQRKQCWPIRGS